LETRSDRATQWLRDCAKRISTQHGSGASAAANDLQVAVVVVGHDGTCVASLTTKDLELACSTKFSTRTWRRIERHLIGHTLIIHQSVAGLDCDRQDKRGLVAGSGVLDAKQNAFPPTADLNPNLFTDTGWRITALKREREALIAVEDGPQIARFVTQLNAGGVELAGFAVLRKRSADSESENAHAMTSTPQTLSEHTESVVHLVREISTRLGMDAILVQALEIAARYHDIGKAAAVWQRAAGAPKHGGPWAKTAGYHAQWSRLQGYRHEFGSLVELEKRNDLPEATRDLILHLVSAHHGRARPHIPYVGCEILPPSQAAASASAAALRFARLQKHYGAWTLAWIETVLRAADQQASRGNEENRHG